MATFLPAQPRRAKTRLVPGKAAARSTARRIMSAMLVDAGEAVSRQCPRAEASRSYPPATRLPGQAVYPWAVR
jgi:hypothetical protein